MPLSFLSASGDGPAPLNASQYAAVTASNAPQLVLAGPGTGKTRVLTYRAAYLLRRPEAPVAPSDLVLVTFTRKAAGQLRQRLVDLVGRPGTEVRAGTLHFFAYSLIRKHTAPLGLPPDFLVADDALTEPFWQSVAREHPALRLDDLKKEVSRLRLSLGKASPLSLRVKPRYEDYLAARGMVDFDGLLLYARDLLRDHADVRARLQERCGALLVDEFQDTDPVQFQILQSIMCPHRQGLFAVADDDQSIYAFRGADVQNVRRFQKLYRCAPEHGNQHVLRDNYRSSANIFAVAESVLDARDRMKRPGDVVPLAPPGERVRVVSCGDEDDEVAWVAERLRSLIKERGARCADLAILAPSNRLNSLYEEALLAMGIPCDVSGDDRLTEEPVVARLRAYLELLHALAGPAEAQRGARFDALVDAVFLLHADVAALDTLHACRALCVAAPFPSLEALRTLARQGFAGTASEATAATWIITVLESLTLLLVESNTSVADLARALLPLVDESPGLLALVPDALSSPSAQPSTAAAAARLREALSGGARVVVDHPRAVPERLLTLVVEACAAHHASEGLPPAVVEARTLRARKEAVRLGARDLVITTDAAHTRAWLDAVGLPLDAPDDRPVLLDLAPENTAARSSGCRYAPVDAEGLFESPAVRLFKLVQATVPPASPGLEDYTVIDLETTGLDTSFCRVVEFGAVRVRGGKAVQTFETRVALPPDLSTEETQTLREVSGFAPSDFEHAPPLEEAWARFLAFVGRDALVAYNGALFDFPVLDRLARTLPGNRSWGREHDVLLDARRLLPALHSHRAEAVAQHLFGEDAASTAHRALSDCHDQHRIYEALKSLDATRRQATGFEPFLAATAMAMGGEAETSLRHEEEKLLFQVGFLWFARGEHPVIADIRRALPSALDPFEALTRRRAFAAALENLPAALQKGRRAPRLHARLEALLRPYASSRVADGATAELLAFLALWNEPRTHAPSDVVTVSTYHAAKGLEFEHVFCTGVDDQSFPWWFLKGDDEAIRESRRVLYVGLTRCKSHLTVSYPRRSRSHTRHLSRFLGSLPAQCVEYDRA